MNRENNKNNNVSEEILYGRNAVTEAIKSGMAINKNLVVVNAPARIDSDYRGELLVGLKNISDKPITIEAQSRIAQCTLHREVQTSFVCGKVIDNTSRSDGGLGHTGETEIVNN